VARIAKAGAKVADQWGRNRVKAAAIEAKVDPAVAAPIVDSAAMNPEMVDLVGELAPHVLAEHGLDPAVSPTGCIVGIVGAWFLGVQSACSSLRSAAAKPDESKPEVARAA
jgi:hypothetical protein